MNFKKFLAHGGIVFDSSETLCVALHNWSVLAYRGISPLHQPPDTPGLNSETLANWAASVLDAAKHSEGAYFPIAELERLEDHALRLTWRGTFPEGRFVTVVVEFDDEGSFLEGKLLWDTGTGRPSRFLGIEWVLRYPFTEFWVAE